MPEELDSLRAEVAALRADLAEEREARFSRRRLLTGLAGLGAAGAAGVAGAKPAGAADGDPLLIGENNDATTETFLTATFDGSESEVILASQPWGVFGRAETIGVLGSVAFDGVAGVYGYKDEVGGAGVTGEAAHANAMGVMALSQTGPAIGANSVLDGVALELQPAERTGPPNSMPQGLEEYRTGAISVDDRGEMWLCVATGAPGTWTRLLREDTAAGRVVPITPVRVLDTRVAGGRPVDSPVVPGQKKGPLLGGQAITLDLAGVGDIPNSASGVVGNLTVVSPSYNGYLTAAPSGSTSNTSSLNFTKDTIVANAFTSALGPGGLTIRASGTAANRYELVVDITAYIS